MSLNLLLIRCGSSDTGPITNMSIVCSRDALSIFSGSSTLDKAWNTIIIYKSRIFFLGGETLYASKEEVKNRQHIFHSFCTLAYLDGKTGKISARVVSIPDYLTKKAGDFLANLAHPLTLYMLTLHSIYHNNWLSKQAQRVKPLSVNLMWIEICRIMSIYYVQHLWSKVIALEIIALKTTGK